jgi:hypothetical protein
VARILAGVSSSYAGPNVRKGSIAGFRGATFETSRRLSKPLNFRPQIAVANILISARTGCDISARRAEQIAMRLNRDVIRVTAVSLLLFSANWRMGQLKLRSALIYGNGLLLRSLSSTLLHVTVIYY